MRPPVAAARVLALLWLVASAGTASAQQPPLLVVFPVELNQEAAYVINPADVDLAQRADARLREELVRRAGYTLAETPATAGALEAARADGSGCTGRACAIAAATAMGTDHALLTTLTKVSDLIWMVDSFLIHVPSGEVVHAENLELKGAPADMVLGGMGVLARRMSPPEVTLPQ